MNRPLVPQPEWFTALVQLMTYGSGAEDHLAGIVHQRVDDDGGVEFRYRVARRGELFEPPRH